MQDQEKRKITRVNKYFFFFTVKIRSESSISKHPFSQNISIISTLISPEAFKSLISNTYTIIAKLRMVPIKILSSNPKSWDLS